MPLAVIFRPKDPDPRNPTFPMKPDKVELLRKNSALWLAAMVLPGILSIAFASSKFPWQMVLPLLLIGPMLASNRMLAAASDGSPGKPETK